MNNLDLGDEQSHENEADENNFKKTIFWPSPGLLKGINKMNLFDRIVSEIFWYTLEYVLRF